jgi:hypothetical protein
MPKTRVELASARKQIVVSHNLDAAGVLGELFELLRLPWRKRLPHTDHEKAS